MCCRCYIEYLKDEELRKMYDLLDDKEDLKTEGEIFPTDNMIVISKNRNDKISVFKMKWGYTIDKLNIFNARMESLDNKAIFKNGIEERRCVIPVSNYFEWEKYSKVKYKIKDKGSVTYLLGIYRFEDNKPVFTIITKDASNEMKCIHDRMPLAIKKENISKWLRIKEDSKEIMNNTTAKFNFEVV